MDIWSILEEASCRFGERTAVVDGDFRLSYHRLHERACALSASLFDRGVRAGDRVAVMEVNSHRYLECYFAVARLGAILTSINYRLVERDVSFILADSGASVLLVNREFAGQIPGSWKSGERIVWLGVQGEGKSYEELISADIPTPEVSSVGPDDVAHLYYTSGTTGRPKGVKLTHRNVVVHSRWAVEELKLCVDDAWGHIAPMFHLADAWATFAVTMVGGCHVMVGKFDAGEVLRAIEENGVTLSNLIPTMLNLMTLHEDLGSRNLASLRVVLSGGAPIAPEVVRRTLETFGCDYIQTYGMTETSPYLTLSILHPHLESLPDEERLRIKSRTGRPFGRVELKVVDDRGRPVAADDRQVGEIWVKGETVTPGYWNRPDATTDAFQDGWLKTGDLAVLDGEGYVNIVDRKKDMIITGGENVYSVEVESALYEHPSILEVAVYGTPDERWGEAVTAAIVLRRGHGANSAELISFLKDRLAGYKIPKDIRFLDELPRTGSGKIAKRLLTEGTRKRG